jgi:hypothetical protein
VTDPASPQALHEPLTCIADAVCRLEPTLDGSVVTGVVRQAVPVRAHQRRLAQALTDDPAMLIAGRHRGPAAVERLIAALQVAGAQHLTVPRCGNCDRVVPLRNRNPEGFRICSGCATHKNLRFGICAACGHHRRLLGSTINDARCRPCDQRRPQPDPIVAIRAHVTQLAPDADPDVVDELTCQAAPNAHQRRRVARDLGARADLLTGNAHDGSPALVRLVELLVKHHIAGVVAPTCPLCLAQRPLRFKRDGRRCCRNCYDQTRHELCDTCGHLRPVASRTSHGQPQCRSCAFSDPVNQQRCTGCQQVRPIARRTDTERLCRRCWRHHPAVCSICGQHKPCSFAFTASPRCDNCYQKLAAAPCARCGKTAPRWTRDETGQLLCGSCGRRREPCCRCGRTRRVGGRIPDGPICRTCYQHEPAYFKHCDQCGAFEKLHHFGLCQACAAPVVLRRALTRPDGTVRTELEPVIAVLLAGEAAALLHWLQRPSIKTFLADLAAAAGPITHSTLDQAPPARTQMLRSALVAAGVLPPRDDYLIAIERRLDRRIATVTHDEDRQTLRSYTNWFHLRRLRRLSPITRGQTNTVWATVAAATRLLQWLADHGMNLRTCTQTDIDNWLPTASGNHRARPFIDYALRSKAAANITIPAPQREHLPNTLPDDDRWTLVRRLLTDTTLHIVDRIAGTLVLLYAQPLTRITQLRTEHVTKTDKGIVLQLGSKPLDVPPPLDELLLQQVSNRRGHGAVGHSNDTENPWLFPGVRPGRPLSPFQLMRRLQAHGIAVRASRNTALVHLATELPTPVISQLLGMSLDTAERWAAIAGTGHLGYAADVSRRR